MFFGKGVATDLKYALDFENKKNGLIVLGITA